MRAAADAGYDVTMEEMIEADKEFKAEKAKKTKLSVEELDAVAGGMFWYGEAAPDGHEMGCLLSYHKFNYQEQNDIWCKSNHYCKSNVATILHNQHPH